MAPVLNVTMQTINEKTAVSSIGSGKQHSSKLKSALGIFKKSKNKVKDGVESISSDGSFILRSDFNNRKPSLSFSDEDEDVDEENLLVGELVPESVVHCSLLFVFTNTAILEFL